MGEAGVSQLENPTGNHTIGDWQLSKQQKGKTEREKMRMNVWETSPARSQNW